jgi:glycine/D-amino acid oxidase-like deaminating enzyme
METDTLIVGQGLCGTWLSFWLQEAGVSFLVLDELNANSASKVASGIINPVTGRRMVKTWLADTLLPFAENSYKKIGGIVGAELIVLTDMLDFFSAPDRRLDFEKRAQQFESFLNWPAEEHDWLSQFNYPFGYGIISPVYQVAIQTMLLKWRTELMKRDCLLQGKYEPAYLIINKETIEYKDIRARRIIFCEGAAVMQHHFFNALPFAINKGEALIISVPGLSAEHLYKKTNVIAPWRDGLFWVGSSYDREFADDKPSSSFRYQTTAWLEQFLKIPFAIEDHVAALRPTTVERRPFAGMHPHQPLVGIFNGMGTKGVSLAPYFGKQLAEHIINHHPIASEADVKRHSRVLHRF